jgi:hypothetical protein
LAAGGGDGMVLQGWREAMSCDPPIAKGTKSIAIECACMYTLPGAILGNAKEAKFTAGTATMPALQKRFSTEAAQGWQLLLS